MGAWKEWAIGMAESGYTPRQIDAAAERIKGTDADPLVRRLAEQEGDDE